MTGIIDNNVREKLNGLSQCIRKLILIDEMDHALKEVTLEKLNILVTVFTKVPISKKNEKQISGLLEKITNIDEIIQKVEGSEISENSKERINFYLKMLIEYKKSILSLE